jgi:hypothetical protein
MKLHKDKIDYILVNKLLKENSIEIESLMKRKDGKPKKRLDNKSLKRIEAINLYSDYLEKKNNILKDKIAQ